MRKIKNTLGIKSHLGDKLFKNTYIQIVNYGFVSFIGIIFWVISARYYDTKAVGLASAVVASLSLISIISNLGLGVGIIRFLPSANNKETAMINTCLTFGGIVSVVSTLIYILGANIWSPSLVQIVTVPSYFILFLISGIVWSMNPLISCVFLAKRSTEFTLLQNVIASVLKILLLILFAHFIRNDHVILTSILIAMIIALIISVFIFIPLVQKDYVPRIMIEKNILNEMSHYSWSNFISKIFQEGLPVILPLMVIYFLGAEFNAYFNIVWSIIAVLMMIPVSVFNSLLAEGSNDNQLMLNKVKKALKFELFLLIPGIIMIILFSNEILMLFGQNYSTNGSYLLRILALSMIPYSINYLYITIQRIKIEIDSIIMVSTITSLLILLLCYYLIQVLGIIGIGIGWIIGQSIMASLLALSLYRSFGKKGYI